MKVKYTTANGRLEFDFEGATHKDVIAKLAAIQELFEQTACGKCKGTHIRFDVREFDGNAYYKLVCDCGAQLDMGQHKTGGSLFIKRRDKDNRPLPDNGWYVWQKGDNR